MNNRDLKVTLSIDDEKLSLAGFVQKANEYRCSIWVEKDDRKVNAKSLLGVLSLGIVCGTTVNIIADGVDEQEAVDTLAELVNSKFEE